MKKKALNGFFFCLLYNLPNTKFAQEGMSKANDDECNKY